ncbi:MAG: hypothetical protein CVU11_00435 [Bacteroidetes bacterium HGW-Bacteroidetes-6]|jgi:outer membrane protein|nr:MAG: hypothetical protein CVU11_00435 [Bacteroidetes bacterium HGW-Bacteroidetes-6]
MENQNLPGDNTPSTEKQTRCALNGQSIFNIVAAVVIVLLVVMQFYNPFVKTINVAGNDNGDLRIAFVVSDSLMTKCVMVDTMSAQLARLQDSLQKDLQTRQQGFEARVNLFQQNMQNGKITTETQAKQQQIALQNEQEGLMALNDQYTNQISTIQLQMNYALIDSVNSVIKHYPEEFPYDFVLGYTKGAGILYASDKFDITSAVLEKLNQDYKPE